MTETRKITTRNARQFLIMDIAFIVLIAGALIFALWKCRYGFGGNDESFYLTVPHRLTLGDALIKDEWHLSQLSSFLLLPFVKLYTMITGGTTGILLAARYGYIVMHLAVSSAVYIRLRKYGWGALAASVLYFVFTPYDIMALSYNTMGLDLVTLAGVILGTANYAHKTPLIISGAAFAGAVLCNPYLIAAYPVFALCMVVNLILKRLNKSNKLFSGDYFSFKTFWWFTVGAAAMAVVFLLFLFSRTSFKDIQTNLPYMMADPEHPSIPLATKLGYYFSTMWNCTELFKYSFYAYGAVLIAIIADFRRKKHRVVYLALTCGVVIFAYCTLIENLVGYNYNYIMFPALFLGITSYILCDQKPRSLLVTNFSLGIIYSFAMCLSSNQYFYVQSMAISSTNISSFVFAGILISEIAAQKYPAEKDRINVFSYQSGGKTKVKTIKRALLFTVISAVFAISAVLFQLTMQVYAKANHIFWELPIPYLTSTLQGGPADGIITNQANANTYQCILSDIMQGYSDKEDENILFLTEKTWTYLAAQDMDYGTFSAWISGENATALTRLSQFYAINPEKIPKYIYIPKESKWDFSTLHTDAITRGYSLKETSWGYMLEKK